MTFAVDCIPALRLMPLRGKLVRDPMFEGPSQGRGGAL